MGQRGGERSSKGHQSVDYHKIEKAQFTPMIYRDALLEGILEPRRLILFLM